LPWENCPIYQTQVGMSAFGKQRDPNIRIDNGNKELVQGNLKSETVLPLFEENMKNFPSQKGLTSFGAHRKNVGKVVDSHEYESSDKVKLGETIIPKIMLCQAVGQSDITPIGSLRLQIPNVQYSEKMSKDCEKESNTFINRQFKPNITESAGSCVMDRRRNVISCAKGVGEIKCERMSEGIIPRIYATDEINKRAGADFGAFRPTIQNTEGGYKMDYEQEVLCKLVLPFQTAPSYAYSRSTTQTK